VELALLEETLKKCNFEFQVSERSATCTIRCGVVTKKDYIGKDQRCKIVANEK